MRFVVTNLALNEVEVKLAWESKKKIKKIAFWTLMPIASAVVANQIIKNQNADSE